MPWNDVGSVYMGYTHELDTLRDGWGITDRAEWRKQLNALLDGRNSPPEPDFALKVREELRIARGAPPSPDEWRETAAGHAQDLGASPAAVRRIEDLVRRIVRYEARFRADGLLAPDDRVRRTVAYDYGRAVNLARWGLSARFCAPPRPSRRSSTRGRWPGRRTGPGRSTRRGTRWGGCCVSTGRSTARSTNRTWPPTAS